MTSRPSCLASLQQYGRVINPPPHLLLSSLPVVSSKFTSFSPPRYISTLCPAGWIFFHGPTFPSPHNIHTHTHRNLYTHRERGGNPVPAPTLFDAPQERKYPSDGRSTKLQEQFFFVFFSKFRDFFFLYSGRLSKVKCFFFFFPGQNLKRDISQVESNFSLLAHIV